MVAPPNGQITPETVSKAQTGGEIRGLEVGQGGSVVAALVALGLAVLLAVPWAIGWVLTGRWRKEG